MTDHATPLVMAQQTHRVPDGTRPLVVHGAARFIRPAQASEAHDCFCADWASKYGDQVARSCQKVISPAHFYLMYRSPDGTLMAYCAPCAIREWADWDVREATV